MFVYVCISHRYLQMYSRYVNVVTSFYFEKKLREYILVPVV